MTKNEAKEVANATRAIENGYGHLAARQLATVHRAGSSRTQKEIVAIFEQHPELRQFVTFENGCFVPK